MLGVCERLSEAFVLNRYQVFQLHNSFHVADKKDKTGGSHKKAEQKDAHHGQYRAAVPVCGQTAGRSAQQIAAAEEESRGQASD